MVSSAFCKVQVASLNLKISGGGTQPVPLRRGSKVTKISRSKYGHHVPHIKVFYVFVLNSLIFKKLMKSDVQ